MPTEDVVPEEAFSSPSRTCAYQKVDDGGSEQLERPVCLLNHSSFQGPARMVLDVPPGVTGVATMLALGRQITPDLDVSVVGTIEVDGTPLPTVTIDSFTPFDVAETFDPTTPHKMVFTIEFPPGAQDGDESVTIVFVDPVLTK